MKELTRYADGRLVLTDDAEQDETLWASDADDDFLEEFGETIDSEDIGEVIEYLMDAGYLEEDEALDVVDEADEDTQTVETLDLYDDDDEDKD